MDKPAGQPRVGDPAWLAYNAFKGTPAERKKEKETQATIKLLLEVFGGKIIN